jgi:hypothetical protein
MRPRHRQELGRDRAVPCGGASGRRGLDVAPFKAQNMSNNARNNARVVPTTDKNPALLEPGPRQIHELTGVPLVAEIPMLRDHGLPEEDGWYGPVVSSRPPGLRTVAIVVPPRISNLDEFAPLAAVPDLRLVWARTAAELAGAAIGWQAASVPGVDAHGLFESSEVARALFGAQAPTLEASFERLAECIEAASVPGVLDDLPAGR